MNPTTNPNETRPGGLVLGRKENEEVRLTTPNGETIVVTIVRIQGDKVRVHVAAPRSVAILRGELVATPPLATQTPAA